MNNLGDLIQTFYPKAVDCAAGHIGEPVVEIESELADDRYYEIKVTRCGHCGMPLKDEYED